MIAPDKFKGSMKALEAAQAIAEGISRVMPGAEFDLAPLADGGEGTVDVFSGLPTTELRTVACRDALGRPQKAAYAWIPGERLAVIEMSEASGLAQIPPNLRDPLRSSTYGTGELIRDAWSLNPATVAVGLGGSATNDAGAGMAGALGWQFLDGAGAAVEPVPANFLQMRKIVPPVRLPVGEVLALCDVRNPLLGERGCSRVFAPQKGSDAVETLEQALSWFADLCQQELGVDHRDRPGAGAAGGLGFGLMTFCGARVVSGFDWIAERIGLEDRVRESDLVITGEGSLDAQTLEGKGPAALAGLARKHGKRCIAFAGRVEEVAHAAFDCCIPISNPAMELAESLSRGAQLLREAAEKAAREISL